MGKNKRKPNRQQQADRKAMLQTAAEAIANDADATVRSPQYELSERPTMPDPWDTKWDGRPEELYAAMKAYEGSLTDTERAELYRDRKELLTRMFTYDKERELYAEYEEKQHLHLINKFGARIADTVEYYERRYQDPITLATFLRDKFLTFEPLMMMAWLEGHNFHAKVTCDFEYSNEYLRIKFGYCYSNSTERKFMRNAGGQMVKNAYGKPLYVLKPVWQKLTHRVLLIPRDYNSSVLQIPFIRSHIMKYKNDFLRSLPTMDALNYEQLASAAMGTYYRIPKLLNSAQLRNWEAEQYNLPHNLFSIDVTPNAPPVGISLPKVRPQNIRDSGLRAEQINGAQGEATGTDDLPGWCWTILVVPMVGIVLLLLDTLAAVIELLNLLKAAQQLNVDVNIQPCSSIRNYNRQLRALLSRELCNCKSQLNGTHGEATEDDDLAARSKQEINDTNRHNHKRAKKVAFGSNPGSQGGRSKSAKNVEPKEVKPCFYFQLGKCTHPRCKFPHVIDPTFDRHDHFTTPSVPETAPESNPPPVKVVDVVDPAENEDIAPGGIIDPEVFDDTTKEAVSLVTAIKGMGKPAKDDEKKPPLLVLCGDDIQFGCYDGITVPTQMVPSRYADATDEIHHVKMSGPGYCLVCPYGKKGQTMVMTRAYFEVTLCGMQVVVFRPLLNNLKRDLPIKTTGEAVLNAARTLADMRYHELDPVIALNTCKYHVISSMERKMEVADDVLRALDPRNVNPTAAITPADVFTFVTCERHGSVRHLNTVACDIPIDCDIRTDIIKDVYHYYNGKKERVEELRWENLRYHSFGKKDIQQTVYFRLLGTSTKHFVVYDNSSQSLEKGFKRLIGARDDEFMLNLHANNLFVQLCASCKKYRQDNTFRMSYSNVDITDEVCQLFGRKPVMMGSYCPPSISMLLDRCNWWFLRQVLDTLCVSLDRTYMFLAEHVDHCYHAVWRYFSRSHMAQIPHVKQKLRIQYVEGQRFHIDDDTMVRCVEAKVKIEPAKFNKVPRLFVAYDAGCMYASELPEFVKKCIGGRHRHCIKTKDGTFTLIVDILTVEFSKSLDAAMRNMVTATARHNYLYVAIYSDDSTYSGCVNGKQFAYNVDISSCDSSNGNAMFYLVAQLMSGFCAPAAIGLVKQCMRPILAHNPGKNIREYFEFILRRAFEGSGTVLTTLLNCIASYLIAFTVASFLVVDEGTDDAELQDMTEELLHSAAQHVGHAISVESAMDGGVIIYERLTLLKRFPVRTTQGEWTHSICFGCVTRSLGTMKHAACARVFGVDQDTFEHMSHYERMKSYTSGVVQSYVHEPRSELMDTLRHVFTAKTVVRVEQSPLREDVDRAHLTLDPYSINRRYPNYVIGVGSLCNALESVQVGDDISSELLSDFYRVDYSAPPLEDSSSRQPVYDFSESLWDDI